MESSIDDDPNIFLLEFITEVIQRWYQNPHTGEVWPLNEVVYAAQAIIKESLQFIKGGPFSKQYVNEKLDNIQSLMFKIQGMRVIE